MLRGAGDEKLGWRREGDVPAPSADEVRRRLARWLAGRTLLDVALMPGGLMNRNCRLRITGGPDVVLRLYDRDGTVAAKEHALLLLLRENLPVPTVLHACTNPTDGGPPFLVLELIDGVPLLDIRRSGDREAIAACAYDVGRLLARLQHRRFDRVGLLAADLKVDVSRLPSPVTTTALVEHFSRSAAFQRRVPAPLRDDLLRAARDWDDHPRAPAMATTLVHGDFNSRNILVRQEHGRWVVSAILDWELAFAGPAYVDIGSFLRYEPADRPRFEPWFSTGLRDAGVALDGDWLMASRLADLPALCELLACEALPDDVAGEVLELVARCRAARS